MTPKLSIIIPVRDESANLVELIQRLSTTLDRTQYTNYEIIAVDDYSRDSSLKILEDLATSHSRLQVYKKTGLIGKGRTVQEGVEKATGEIMVCIDADLAHPPEVIPNIIEAMESQSADILIAHRILPQSTPLSRRVRHACTKLLFRSILGLNFDVQSGLKAVKRKVFENIQLDTSSWSFDLQLVFQAIHAGFVVKEIRTPYHTRKHGTGKMHPAQAGLELLLMVLKLRFVSPKPVIIGGKVHFNAEIGWNQMRYKPYSQLEPRYSAIETLEHKQKIIFIALLTGVVMCLVINWKVSLIVFISILSVLYFADMLFNLYLIVNSVRKRPEIHVSAEEIATYTKDWPMYTIICPLYKEWEVIPQFVRAIGALDYPKEKIQVILSLEEDDKKTQLEASQMKLPTNFEILVTPHSLPKTKPKACNYALSSSRGAYIVIYDAEDIPDPLQLKQAVVGFAKQDEQIVCLQAKLNFYNSQQNLLTRLFTMEYTLWFGLTLTGLHSIQAPIPLGGTSNHFKREALDVLKGWDPFNVTEDCDLGIRLFKFGYKTMVLDSLTMEEANSHFFGWFKQRSRWIKGYIQTYLVHMRHPHEFITDFNNFHIVTFQLIVGGKVLSMWINPFLWLVTILYFAFRSTVGPFIESLYLTPIFYIAAFSLVFGNFMYFYFYMVGAAKQGQWELVKYAYIVPFYWLMMSVSSWIALQEVIMNPHYWRKTQHGLHLKKSSPAI